MPTFTPPTIRQPMSTGHPLLGRYSIDTGQSVVLRDGTYQVTPFPWLGEIAELEEGTDYFMGGRTYVITDDVADALEGDGFNTVTDAGYGEADYGDQGFGY